ncbi:DUF3570 domain-containing protein [Glaciecola sp. 1036]|uniref:DUF3570 domain-containing protein n=1 Tax=Alteromonadaceae TaxID=72275 RepID=UPI003D076111
MQLIKDKKVAATLAAATCALLGTQPAQANEQKDDAWQFDTAILYYGESDRVQLVEGVFNAKKDFGDEHIFSAKLVVDTLTGASASGAVAQPGVQTFTRPSGNGSYQVNAGETPLDDTFRDTRVQLSGQWTQPIFENTRVSTGFNFSNEYDYLSIGANASLARDFNRKNTTLSFGVSYQFDSIDPVGYAPIGLAQMQLASEFDSEEAFRTAFDATRDTEDKDKDTFDVLLGLTQVINKRMLMQFNYGYSVVDGYLNDPYKLVSVVNDTGLTLRNLHENRPDERTKHNVFWQTKYALDSGVIDVSYRYSTDDWDIDSHTIDSRFRWNISETSYIQPHFRYYTQSAAKFYEPFLEESTPLPMFASADYRLGEMDAYTIGLKYGQTLSNGHKWAVRAEYYSQRPTSDGTAAIGVLNDLDLYPSIDAFILQFNYHF